MDLHQQILTRYWGYSSFRPLQEDIINSIMAGKDTLGLMPTGGGKSITFQIPALEKDGVCLVITPLISLMKDQVGRLKKKGIKASALYSGMSRSEIMITLDNCLYGDYKFLYVSPERTKTELFRAKFEKMKVSLLAVDEAHCISQWGYDFRPSYLSISDLREIHTEVPVLALTATATLDILDDIQDKLKFREKNVLRASFERKNLIYQAIKSDDKLHKLVRIVQDIHGSGIIYVRSRKSAREIAEELKRNRISATYYHAGLDYTQRDKRQDDWTKGSVRIIVATNAFGMGIDKAEVRFVLHYDIPDSVESYFQESGRAGRDNKDASTILLYNKNDKSRMDKRVRSNFPEIKEIKRIYEAIGNYFQIPVGGGKNLVLDFNIGEFASRFKLNMVVVYNSLKILEREGYLELTEEVRNPSRVHFLAARDDLYRFQVENRSFDGFIKLILRSYTGLFSEFVPIVESFLARKGNISTTLVEEYLKRLSSLKIISYIPGKRTPFIIYSEERLDKNNLAISHDKFVKRKEGFILRQKKMWDYVASKAKCRSQFLLDYFGEKDAPRCGKCDICTGRNDLGLSVYEFDLILEEMKNLLQIKNYKPEVLVAKLNMEDDKVVKVIRFLLDNGKIKYDKDECLCWSRPL